MSRFSHFYYYREFEDSIEKLYEYEKIVFERKSEIEKLILNAPKV